MVQYKDTEHSSLLVQVRYHKPSLDRISELLLANRLRQEAVHATLLAQPTVGLDGVRRQGDDGSRAVGIARVLADLLGGLETVHHRHVAVHQNDIELLLLRDLFHPRAYHAAREYRATTPTERIDNVRSRLPDHCSPRLSCARAS